MGVVKRFIKIGLLVGSYLLLCTASTPCLAADNSPWMLRARLLGVSPDDSSTRDIQPLHEP